MPCYVTGSAAGDSALYLKEAQEEATKTTEMLCETLQILESKNPKLLKTLSPQIKKWWKNHKKIDSSK